MQIVGGIYVERTVFPESDLIFGSGGRAAAALNHVGDSITLYSFVGKNRKRDVEYHVEKIWGFNLEPYYVPEIVSFDYFHGLSSPVIKPSRLPVAGAPVIEVTGETILQFGMLEGEAVVKGSRVIYDPQNPNNPELFGTNGSTAEELVYVLNQSELRKLTGEMEVGNAAKSLLKNANVRAVVVKSGAFGARVFSEGSDEYVPAYETGRVWPIGSGDIFAAAFAHFWGAENTRLKEAALYASRAAALYCDRKQVQLNREELTSETFCFPKLKPAREPSEARIYLAGPFFTMGEQWLVEEARNALLSAGFDVFSPYHDVGSGSADQVVPADLDGLEKSQVTLALCDGLDAGTLFEVGYAVKMGMPVVAFGEKTSDEGMKMLYGTGCKVFRDFPSAIYHAQWEAIK